MLGMCQLLLSRVIFTSAFEKVTLSPYYRRGTEAQRVELSAPLHSHEVVELGSEARN